MRDATHTAPIAPGTIPLPGLLEIAGEAMLAEFRQELAKNGYEDIRPTHGCVFRFVREDGMRLTELAVHAGIDQAVGRRAGRRPGRPRLRRTHRRPRRQAGQADLPHRSRPRGPASRLRPLHQDRAALGRALRRAALRAAARATRGDRRRPRPRRRSRALPSRACRQPRRVAQTSGAKRRDGCDHDTVGARVSRAVRDDDKQGAAVCVGLS